MSDCGGSDQDQVMGAFGTDAPEEIVHIVGDEEEDISAASQKKCKNAEDSDLVIMVPPLLSASKDQDRIPISISEIKRRVEAPEKLCATNLLSLLHLSKPRTPELKETLSQYGLEKISKRSSVVSSFSKLSEMEASHLAEDFYFLASRSLPVTEVGNTLADENGGWKKFSSEGNAIKELLEDVFQEVEDKDTTLNLATHGFSTKILRSTLDLISDILTNES